MPAASPRCWWKPAIRVRKGQVLARLNPITAQSQLDAAEASLDEVRANAAVAQSEWVRAQQGDDLFSKEENERRRSTALTARAKIRAAEAQVVDARNKLAHTIICADRRDRAHAKRRGGSNCRPGIYGPISPGARRPNRDARTGGRAGCAPTGPRPERDGASGRRAQHLHRHDLADWRGHRCQHTAGHRPHRPAGGPESAPGAFARADIEVGSTTGVLLPQTAVLSDEKGNYVLVVGGDNKVERRAVTVGGARSEGLLVSQGLDGSERVVAIAGAFLRIGETVAIAGKAS